MSLHAIALLLCLPVPALPQDEVPSTDLAAERKIFDLPECPVTGNPAAAIRFTEFVRDGRGGRIACRDVVNSQVRLWLDDRPGPWECNIEGLRMTPAGRLAYHLATTAEPFDERAACIVIDGKRQPHYDEVRDFAFGDGGRTYAYLARRGANWKVVIDDKVAGVYRHVERPVAGPGGRWAFRYSEDGESWLMVGKERIGPKVFPRDPAWSRDGLRFAWVEQVSPRPEVRVVVDGAPSKSYRDIAAPTFSPDGRLVYFARNDAGGVLVDDGKEVRGGWGERIAFSPSGKRLACVETRDGRARVVVDGQEGEPFLSVTDPVFSPDGKHVAYAGFRGEKAWIVVDGSRHHVFDRVTAPVFSPDSSRFAYVAHDGGRMFVVVDATSGWGESAAQSSRGRVSRAHRHLFTPPQFSSDGKWIGYLAIDEIASEDAPPAAELWWRLMDVD